MTFTLEIHFSCGRYIMTGLNIKALLQEIRRADDCMNITKLVAYPDSNSFKSALIHAQDAL